MNEGHEKALKRFKTLGLIGELDLAKPLSEQYLATGEGTQKQAAINAGSTQDAKSLAGAVILRCKCSRYIK